MSGLQLSAEARLVFRSADPRVAGATMHGLVAEVRDWHRVISLAEAEGATGVLWRRAKRDRLQLPADVAHFLQQRTMLSDFRMQRLAARLDETVAALRTAGVPVLLLKGAAIGATQDATFRLRPMTDVDILVHPGDVDRAVDALGVARWRPTDDTRIRELLQDHQHLPPFVDPTLQGLRLELHSRLLPADHSFTLPDEWIWDTSVDAPAPFLGARVPAAPLLLVHTAIHYAWQHSLRFGPWRTMRSVGLLTADSSWSWEALVAAARESRSLTACYWTLRQAKLFAGIDVPDEVLRALAAPTPEWCRRVLDRHFASLVDPGELPSSPSEAVTRLLWTVALRPRWSGHRQLGRLDPERRWERAFGIYRDERLVERVTRHVEARGHWWSYLRRTLLGR